MNIKQLQYFISVSEHLSFTNAAKEHYLSQTAISQQIKNLEDTLGFKLLFRDKHSVKLTPSGEIFYLETKLLLKNLNTAINKAYVVSLGYIGTINIGFFESYKNLLLPKLLSEFNIKYPKIKLNLIKGNSDELYKKLQNNSIDFIFGYDFSSNKYSFIESKLISTSPLCVVVYNNHKFASRYIITRNELKNENFIFISRTISPISFDVFVSSFSNYGFSPNIKYKVDSVETSLLMVESELGITILPKPKDNYKQNNLVFIPLENEFVNSIISWNKNNTDSKIEIFINFLKNQNIIT